jgi:hypothetical protein
MSLNIAVPFVGDLLIKKGQEVDFTTPFCKRTSTELVHITLSSVLNTEPKNIFQYLKKFVGDEIKKGDLVAEKKNMLSKKKYTSQHDGVIKEINHEEGTLTIEVLGQEQDTQYCFFRGEIQDLEKKQEEGMHLAVIKLKTEHHKEYELKEVSENFGGEILRCTDPIKAKLSSEDVEHRVVVDDRIPSYEQVKYEALGAQGFVMVHSLPEKSNAAYAILKHKEEYDEIMKSTLSLCLVNKVTNKVYLYQ